MKLRRFTVYTCEGCGWVSDTYDKDPDCNCDPDDDLPEVRDFETVAIPDLAEWLEREIGEAQGEAEQDSDRAEVLHEILDLLQSDSGGLR